MSILYQGVCDFEASTSVDAASILTVQRSKAAYFAWYINIINILESNFVTRVESENQDTAS